MKEAQAGNVWFYMEHFDLGEVERTVLNLMTGLKARGWLPVLVLNQAEGALLEQLPPEIPLVELGVSSFFEAVQALGKRIRNEKPSLLVSQRAYLNSIAVLATAFSGHKLGIALAEHTLLTRGWSDSRHPKSWTEQMVRWSIPALYRRASSVIGISRGVAQDLSKCLWMPAERITVIYNPTISHEIRQLAQASWNPPWEDDLPMILAVGRLEQEKGFDLLVRAFSEVLRHRQARLAILGEGPEKESLLKTAEALGIQDMVVFPGVQANPYPWFREAGVFVLSSLVESFPSVIIEALALGAPVVSFDCPEGPREILTHGKDGLLVPLGDIEHLGKGIRDILGSPRLANALRIHGYARAKDFTFEKTLSAYEALFKEILP